MAAPPSDHVVEWEGTSLADLVSALQASALPVRIEVIAPGPVGSGAGEVHLLAGGLADAFAGSLRRDDAMAALQRLEGARFLVECRLPDPESGSLGQAGPASGSLKDRPLPALMRYCEDYVLTCQLEVSRGPERAVVNYKRGELINTTIDDKDGDDRLADMLAWRDGSYHIVLATPELPPAPQRRRDSQPLPRVVEAAAKADRKRHTTLPGTASRPVGNTPVPASAVKTAAKGPEVTLPFAAGKIAAGPTSAPPPARMPAVPPVSSLRLSPAPELPGASRGAPPASAKPGAPDAALAQQMTKRGLPSIPAVPPVPQPPLPKLIPAAPAQAPGPPRPFVAVAKAASPATAHPPAVGSAKPATGSAVAPAAVSAVAKPAPAAPLATKPAAPPAALSSAKLPAPTAPPAPVSTKPAVPPAAAPAKSAVPAVQPAAIAKAGGPALPSAKPAAPAVLPAPVSAKASAAGPSTKSGMPAVQPPAAKPAPPPAAKPAPPPAAATAQPMAPTPLPGAAPPVPPAAATAKPPVMPAPPAVAAAATSAAPEAVTAPIVRKGVTAPRMGAVQAPVAKGAPSASNDLKPASGLIEARPRRLSHPRPAAAPVEVAEEPPPISRPVTPSPVTPQMAAQRRARTSARKKTSARPVRIYVLMGLAIGIGIVVAYWLYFSMNVGR